MNVQEAIRARRSVRDYSDRPVPEESLLRVLEAARLAPSSSNRQEWRFLVVKDEARRRDIARAANNQTWIADAPVIIAIVATDNKSIMTCGIPRYAVDCAIAITQMMLAAAEEGLGTCWIGAFSQERARAILGAPPDATVVTVMPLGYPRSTAGFAKSRKSFAEVVRAETYDGALLS
jgi:nitroreductase